MTDTPKIDRLITDRVTEHPVPPDLSPVPRTGVAIVTCMDARIDPYKEFGLQPGDAHVIRTAGATVTEDVLRSLTASQWALGTTEVLVLGHTGCGMAGIDEAALHEMIRAAGAEPPAFPMRGFADVDSNVRDGVAMLRSAAFLRPDTRVRGFVYDLETGDMHEIT